MTKTVDNLNTSAERVQEMNTSEKIIPNIELLPCPFCGQSAKLMSSGFTKGGKALWLICCFGCDTRTAPWGDTATLIRQWNKRVSSSDIAAAALLKESRDTTPITAQRKLIDRFLTTLGVPGDSGDTHREPFDSASPIPPLIGWGKPCYGYPCGCAGCRAEAKRRKASSDTLNSCRKAFESRHTPNLDLKRNEDGSYRYQAAQLAFRDFADAWEAACNHQRREISLLNAEYGDELHTLIETVLYGEWIKDRDAGIEIPRLEHSRYSWAVLEALKRRLKREVQDEIPEIANFPVEACIAEMEQNYQAYIDNGSVVSASVMELCKGIVQHYATQPVREIVSPEEVKDLRECQRMFQYLCGFKGVTPDMLKAAREHVLANPNR